MTELVTLSRAEVERLEDRIRRLARDKAHLQIVNYMMERLGAAAGVDRSVDALLRGVLEHIGGAGAVLYYRAEGRLHRADASGARTALERLDDPLVARAFDTGAFQEVEHAFPEPGLSSPQAETSSSWACPLVAGPEVVGVLVLVGLQLRSQEFRPVLPTFCRFAALLLQHELLGQSRLQQAVQQLEATTAELLAAKAELELRVEVRTAELRVAKERLELELAERTRADAELRRSQEQLRQSQKMEALGLLAGGVAHDFNNILQVIVSFGAILREGLRSPGDLECLDEMLGGAARATELARGLLAFSRRQPLRLAPLDLNAVVTQTHRFLQRLIGEDVALVTALAPEPLVVLGDAAMLQQVLVNLAANARDAMPAGGTLTIATGRAAPEEGAGDAAAPLALLRVGDTGTGIPPELLGRIFEPFFTTKERGKGTGLGLSIVYGIVNQHGGQIRARSGPGQGTTFDLTFPILSGAPAEAAAAEEAPRAAGGESVLVVEDDHAVRRAIRELLLGAGYTVQEAVDGQEAVERYAAGTRCDLVLLDLVMPRRNGRLALEDIRRLRPEQRALFMSGYAADTLDERGLEALDAPAVLKPVMPAALLRAVREALDRPPRPGGAPAPPEP